MGDNDAACCAPSGSEQSADEQPSRARDADYSPSRDGCVETAPTTPDDRTKAMVHLDGGSFTMGTDSEVGFPEDGEGPAREVMVDPF